MRTERGKRERESRGIPPSFRTSRQIGFMSRERDSELPRKFAKWISRRSRIFGWTDRHVNRTNLGVFVVVVVVGAAASGDGGSHSRRGVGALIHIHILLYCTVLSLALSLSVGGAGARARTRTRTHSRPNQMNSLCPTVVQLPRDVEWNSPSILAASAAAARNEILCRIPSSSLRVSFEDRAKTQPRTRPTFFCDAVFLHAMGRDRSPSFFPLAFWGVRRPFGRSLFVLLFPPRAHACRVAVVKPSFHSIMRRLPPPLYYSAWRFIVNSPGTSEQPRLLP